MSPSLLRQHAEAIWRAGVAAVDSCRLMRDAVRVDGENIVIAGESFPLVPIGKIAVVGAGKAGAGMAAGFEEAVGEEILVEKVTGWVNVPADCVRPLRKIHLHAARPAGVNEPTAEGVRGSERILEIVGALGPEDLCVVLLSGGGSALLPAPADGITLADKLAVTRLLMSRGATIGQLNCVRKHLSRIKGGKLALASRAGRTLTLIISDVVGDKLDVIASGPTVADSTSPADALQVLRKFADPANPAAVPPAVWELLGRAATSTSAQSEPRQFDHVRNVIIGSNAIALQAAAKHAKTLNYHILSHGSANEGEARNIGRDLAKLCRDQVDGKLPPAGPLCILSGGEPVVHLAETDEPRKGGRNQEVALAALVELLNDDCANIAILSGGTDGEDGPTDAAGAIVDSEVMATTRTLGLDPRGYLAINNSYPFFEQTGGLFKTGPTHTNVMDLRVALVHPRKYGK